MRLAGGGWGCFGKCARIGRVRFADANFCKIGMSLSIPRMVNRNWTRDQLLVAFRLYCRTPFGRLHRLNPEIIALAKSIGRTPSAVSMKACNFASLDPAQKRRGIRALGNTSDADEALWREFSTDSASVAAEAEAAFEHLAAGIILPEQSEPALPVGPTEVARIVQIRRVQAFFRSAVLNSYDCRCALTGIAVPGLLNASHIIPWSLAEQRRADPRNGLCLNALHDRAFDRGLISFDGRWNLMISPMLRQGTISEEHRRMLLDLEGHNLRLPSRFLPDVDAMTFHRAHVFLAKLD